MLRRKQGIWILGLLTLTVASALPVQGAGFSIFEQGSKAMGMAGAFTAQADDGSAIFHNVGGLAFLKKQRHELGMTVIKPVEVDFAGIDPFPGANATGTAEEPFFTPPHYYYVRPISKNLTFGFGFNSPFGLSVEWKDRANWPGRFLSARSELKCFDLNPSIGWQVNEHLGVGLGVSVRAAKVELFRHVAAINPLNFRVFDAGTVLLESDLDNGLGWNVGLLHKVNRRLSWGFSYRSAIEVDFSGDAVFAQLPSGNPVLDAIVARTIPFNQELPVETNLEFPDLISLGVAFGLTDRVLVEFDLNQTGWSSFDQLPLTFVNHPQFSQVVPEEYEDALHYRLGVRVDAGDNQWRFGYVYDESPQPDESVGPLLPDANRDGITIGFGWHDRLDLAIMYLQLIERTTTTNRDSFFGTYNTTVWLVGATWKI